MTNIESLCPVCGRVYCDHTPNERDQTSEEMNRPLTDFELRAWQSGDDQRKITAARRSQAEAEEAEAIRNKSES